MEKFIIKQGWFRSAGIKYNWVKDGFDVRGIGLAKHVLNSNENIVVEGTEYSLDRAEAEAFIRRFESFYKAGGTLLGVVSKSLLKPLVAPNNGIPEAEEKPEVEQSSLF